MYSGVSNPGPQLVPSAWSAALDGNTHRFYPIRRPLRQRSIDLAWTFITPVTSLPSTSEPFFHSEPLWSSIPPSAETLLVYI